MSAFGTAQFAEARAICEAFLREVQDEDWASSIPGLDMNVAQVVAHIAQATLWYATDLAAQGIDLSAVEQSVNAESPPADLVDTLVTYGRILDAVLRVSPSDARGFHPFGRADVSGFAAMGSDEWLIHTHDIARGLGRDFRPPDQLNTALVTRLFPWADAHPGEDPWQLLQWANGRIPLGERDQLIKWRWQCAPLDEWDGKLPDPSKPLL